MSNCSRFSYDYVGDLAETIALIWPPKRGANCQPRRSAQSSKRCTLRPKPKRRAISSAGSTRLTRQARWGAAEARRGAVFASALAARLAKQALADFGNIPVGEIEEVWHGLTPPYTDLFAWLEGKGERPSGRASAPFRPVMLAHALEEVDRNKIDPADFRRGMEMGWHSRSSRQRWRRAQALQPRGGEDITDAFPDVVAHLSFRRRG